MGTIHEKMDWSPNDLIINHSDLAINYVVYDAKASLLL